MRQIDQFDARAADVETGHQERFARVLGIDPEEVHNHGPHEGGVCVLTIGRKTSPAERKRLRENGYSYATWRMRNGFFYRVRGWA